MTSLYIPENVKLRKIPVRKTKSPEEIELSTTYYERNREKCLARTREKYAAENPKVSYGTFREITDVIDSGAWFYDLIDNLKRNSCTKIIRELGMTERGRTHKYLAKSFINTKRRDKQTLPILKSELNSLESEGMIEKKNEGRKTIYCLTEMGYEMAGKIERILVPYESLPM